jgi:hypothetical protein
MRRSGRNSREVGVAFWRLRNAAYHPRFANYMAIPAVWIAGVALELSPLDDVPAFVFPARDRLQLVYVCLSLSIWRCLFSWGEERLHLDWADVQHGVLSPRTIMREPRRQTEVDTERKTDDDNGSECSRSVLEQQTSETSMGFSYNGRQLGGRGKVGSAERAEQHTKNGRLLTIVV